MREPNPTHTEKPDPVQEPEPEPLNHAPWVLRKAQREDASAITDVYLRSRIELVTCAPLTHTADQVLEWVSDFLVASGETIVALDAGRIVGISATTRAYGVVWLDQLYVDPRDIGRGIGKALLDEVLERAQTVVQLYTFAGNARARTFYERHGFVVVDTSDGADNEEGVPDVLYRRAFAGT